MKGYEYKTLYMYVIYIYIYKYYYYLYNNYYITFFLHN